MTIDPDAAALLQTAAGWLGRPLTDAQVLRMFRYLELIGEHNRRARLTAITRIREAVRLHILDSLLAVRGGIPQGAALIDVGSGAGLPGIPLAIARPDLSVTLLEASARKAAFLEVAASTLALPVLVVGARAETAAHEPRFRERFDIAAARAVAPLPVLCELTLPFVRPGGKAVLLKGPGVARERDAGDLAAGLLGGGLPDVIEDRLPGGIRRSLVVIPKVGGTPPVYPRRTGFPSRRPLAQ